MKSSARSTIVVLCVLAIPSAARAQSNDVTFTVPINLSQLSPDLRRVMVRCDIQSAAIQGTQVPG